MTLFQRCGISIVAHAWCKELLNKPNDRIAGKYVKIYSRARKLVGTFEIKNLSLSTVDMEGKSSEGNLYKFYNESNDPKNFVIKSEDTPYSRIAIEESYPSFIKGQVNNYRFEVKVDTWNQTKVDDQENRMNGEFLYYLE